ncbi:unnamed protein product [Orchesella dallaii]|uniref:Suppressor of cytokine signaling 5 n=1 Tax=Orchesella dallaii TaxID=48710 RepID=A0ABP1QSX2_9HEXA
MGPRLGKLSSNSYDMSSDRGEKRPKKDPQPKTSSAAAAGPSNIEVEKDSDDQSDSKSSTGSGEITCSSWRTRSDRWSKSRRPVKTSNGTGKKDFFGKRNKKWLMSGRKSKSEPTAESESPPNGAVNCVCTMYRKTSTEEPGPSGSSANANQNNAAAAVAQPIIDLSKFNPADYPIDDEDERMRQQRAKEMAEGVDVSLLFGGLTLANVDLYPAHSQVDYIHYLVPDLKEITNCSFYWGKIDRYEAEKLLEGKPEGTFLLRDSAQEEYLFSVSFRRYGRSLHARIEQWNNQFSFDSHDPSVYSSPTVTGLIEHYKDPSCCMFFEPMLTTPLHRNFPFDLQHLARAALCSHLTYDSISKLPLPKSLKMYLKEYHYKQRVRIRRLE